MSIKHHYHSRELLTLLDSKLMGLEYTSVQRIELNGELTINTKNEEICLVSIAGQADFTSKNHSGTIIFKDMVYIPHQETITLYSRDSAVLMRYGAPSQIETEFAHLPFAEIDKDPKRHAIYGKIENNSKRDVWHYISDDFKACRLMMGICQGQTGGWTAWPPHEHGNEREELYTFFDMGNAFGIQCLYEDLTNSHGAALVRDGDIISIPRGYHPNVACPGGRISYVYCMVAKRPCERHFMDLHIEPIWGEKFD